MPLHTKGRVMGAVVDAVSDVLQIRHDNIQPAPDLGATAATDYITGIGCLRHGEHDHDHDHDRMLILIDIDRLMGDVQG